MHLFDKMLRFTSLIPVLALVSGMAGEVYADGAVNTSVYARTATTDSDNDLSSDPVKICKSDNFVGWIKGGTWICFSEFDFGTGPVFLEIVAGAKKDGGVVFLRQDDPYGYEIGQIAIPSTGGWRVFNTFTASLTPNVQSAGKKDLYLCFDGPDGQFNIRSFTVFDNTGPLPQVKTAEEPEPDNAAGYFDEMNSVDTYSPPPETPVASTETAAQTKSALSKLAKLSTPKKLFIALPFVSLFSFFLFFLCKAALASKKAAEESEKGKSYDF